MSGHPKTEDAARRAICGPCQLAKLPEHQRRTIQAEPPTMPIALCPEHQRVLDEITAKCDDLLQKLMSRQ